MWSTILNEAVTTSDHLDRKYIDCISTKTREIKSILVKSHYALRQEIVLKIQRLNGYEGVSEINEIFDAHYLVIENRMTELFDYMQKKKEQKISLLHKYCERIREIGRQDNSDDDGDCIIISNPETAISPIPSSEIIPVTVINEGIQSMESDGDSLESQYESPIPNTRNILHRNDVITETQELPIPSMPTLGNDPEIATNQEVQSMESDIDSEDSEHDSDIPSSNVVDYKMLYKAGKTLKCIECDQLFKTHSEFINHMDAEHHNKKPYRCSDCTKCYGTRSKLTKHISGVHAPRFECDVCHKRLGCESSLKSHCIIHSEERPFECSQCDSSFKRRGQLTNHIRSVHQKERNHHCVHCSKGFFWKSNLIEHLRVHTGEKPFQCAMCGKAFRTKSKLTVHKRLHTGEKPYECSKCHKAFRQSNNMRKHEKICKH